jgi:hypothetical protein
LDFYIFKHAAYKKYSYPDKKKGKKEFFLFCVPEIKDLDKDKQENKVNNEPYKQTN